MSTWQNFTTLMLAGNFGRQCIFSNVSSYMFFGMRMSTECLPSSKYWQQKRMHLPYDYSCVSHMNPFLVLFIHLLNCPSSSSNTLGKVDEIYLKCFCLFLAQDQNSQIFHYLSSHSNVGRKLLCWQTFHRWQGTQHKVVVLNPVLRTHQEVIFWSSNFR